MSVEAITWALRQPIQHSSAKFVLVVLANCAGADTALAWPSVAYLSAATGQDRKTVMANLQRLQEWGLIDDTGKRAGTTKQIIIYRLICGPDLFTAEGNTPKTGTVPKTGQSQNRNSSENGGKQSRFSREESQKRDTEPSLTQKNHHSSAQRSASRFDEWFSEYPKRVGRKPSLARWKADRLDERADQLIADVRRRKAEDGRWLDGFIPDPITYLEEERWTDDLLPRRAGTPAPAPVSASASTPAPAARDWRTPPESDLEHRLAYLRQQHGYGAYGEGAEGDAELERLVAETRAQFEPAPQEVTA